MATNQSRSLNASLHEGETDGLYKKYIQDRDGAVEAVNITEKHDLSPGLYGLMGEATTKITPDGCFVHTPNTR